MKKVSSGKSAFDTFDAWRWPQILAGAAGVLCAWNLVMQMLSYVGIGVSVWSLGAITSVAVIALLALSFALDRRALPRNASGDRLRAVPEKLEGESDARGGGFAAGEAVDCRASAEAAAFKSLEERCADIARANGLSEREQEVLVMLAQGKTRRAIKDELVVSLDTVKTHVQHIYRKLGVHSREELKSLVD